MNSSTTYQKSADELKKMSTQRLLNHYRKIRPKQYAYFCDCGCYEPLWEIGYDKHLENEYNELINYLDSVKNILSNREHLKNKKQNNKFDRNCKKRSKNFR